MDETFVIVGPDGVEHEFPSGMDPKKAAGIVRAQYPDHTGEVDNVFTKPVEQSLVEGAQGFGSQVADAVKAIPGMVMHPVKALEDATQARYDAWNKGSEDFAQGRVVEGLGHKAAGLIPFLGPIAASIGDKLGTGDPEQMGRGVADIAMAAAPTPTGRAGIGRAGTAVKDAAMSPAGKVVVGGGVGYATGGIPGMVAGATGGGVLNKVEAMLDRVAKTTEKQPAVVKVPKEMQPRLTDPRLAQTLEQELQAQLGSITRPDAAVVDPMASHAATASHLDDMAASPARAGAASDFTRTQPANAGGQLSRGGGTAERPFEQELSLADALEELRRPESVEVPLSHPEGGGFTASEPVAANPNRGGRLVPSTPRITPEQIAQEALAEARGPQSAPAVVRPNADALRTTESNANAIRQMRERGMAPVASHTPTPVTSKPVTTTPKAVAEPVPAVVASDIPGSRSKAARGPEGRLSPTDRQIFAENIRKGMSDEDATANMLSQRAERAKANYANAQAASAAKKKTP